MNVHFSEKMQCLSDIRSLIKECRKKSGCILVITYKGHGKFFVNIFDGEGAEIEYDIVARPSSHGIYEVILS